MFELINGHDIGGTQWLDLLLHTRRLESHSSEYASVLPQQKAC